MRLTQAQYEAEIKRQMKILKCSYEEAKDCVDWDLAIESGNKELGALSKEQKALVRSLTKADRKPTEKRNVKRERKVDEEKKMLIEKLQSALVEYETSVKNEAEISFKVGENSYTVKLTKHRAPKE